MKMDKISKQLKWKVHTPNLLTEIKDNPNVSILDKPIVIFARLLGQVSDRAAELNDPQLNALMCRLTMYTIADPLSEDYDREMVEQIFKEGDRRI